jgi:hypothetical protein
MKMLLSINKRTDIGTERLAGASMNHRRNAALFFVLAAVGLGTAWYFNGLAVMLGENYIADGFTSHVDWVYSMDLIVSAIAGVTFIVLECRRLNMRFAWLYIVAGCLTAFAFVFPLFLGFRELALAKRDAGLR